MAVIIAATIEVIDDRGQVLAAGKYGTDKTGYAEMVKAGRRFPERVWAVEGCNGIGRHLSDPQLKVCGPLCPVGHDDGCCWRPCGCVVCMSSPNAII